MWLLKWFKSFEKQILHVHSFLLFLLIINFKRLYFLKLMRIFKIVFVFCFLWLLASCGEQNFDGENKPSLSDSSQLEKPKYAHGFQIIETDNYKILRIFDPWSKGKILQELHLYSENKSSNKEGSDVINLEVPVKSIAIASLDNVGFLGELGALEKVIAVTDANRLFNAKLNHRIAEGKVINLGPAVDLNLEKLVVAKPDVVFSTTYNAGSKTKDILAKSGVITFFNMDWMEASPLGRAEWIKVVGALLGKERMADSIFNQIESNYLNLKNKAMQSVLKPEVIIGSNYKGIWYMPGGNSFKALLLADAGASYYWSKDSSKGSLALSFERVVELQRDADIWLEIPFRSYEEVLAVDKRYGFFKAYKDSMIFNNLGLSNGMANDYWERGLCRPDLILWDLVTILHPELFDHKLLFYNKL